MQLHNYYACTQYPLYYTLYYLERMLNRLHVHEHFQHQSQHQDINPGNLLYTCQCIAPPMCVHIILFMQPVPLQLLQAGVHSMLCFHASASYCIAVNLTVSSDYS